MSKKEKDRELRNRIIGLISAAILTLGSFLVFNYFSSFQTKAMAQENYAKLDKKISIVLCLMDIKYCTGIK